MRWICFLLLFASLGMTAIADGPADNSFDKVRPVPPVPKEPVNPSDRQKLEAGVASLESEISSLKKDLKDKPELLALLPDVIVFHKAVHDALRYNEIHNPKAEVPAAFKQIELGIARAKSLKEGKAPWLSQTGQVVRGYLSKIDGSVQPYGLVIPASYDFKGTKKHRLDFWCHGRGETLSELAFVQGRLGGPGEFTPPNAIVLHLYGRYCCANKFAGEIDCLEALDAVGKNYRVDADRLVMRGFSMGGAAAWQFAVHYPSLFCAAAPGAGFSETAEFLRVFQNEKVVVREDEKKLWHMYDCTDYALNLFNLPTVAYSGENDSQKQAADIMAKAIKAEGMELVHLIGPKTGHSYHPEVKKELNKQIDKIAEQGRPALPGVVKFTTWTLRYPTSYWVTVVGMEEHWERARVEAEITGKTGVKVTTSGVTEMELSMPDGQYPFEEGKAVTVVIDGKSLSVPTAKKFNVKLAKGSAGWSVVEKFSDELHKRHGLQGPIDDAFMDSFLMVQPSNFFLNKTAGDWVDRERQHALTHWRSQFRGEAPSKLDGQVTDEDIATKNLILWGDPSSNSVIKKIADKLPIKWSEKGVVVGGKTYDAGKYVPVLIYPNPLNPKKYVVINSGFTFREYDYLNNARQISKLPDWAIVDASTPMTPRYPGKIEAAGFFDEQWKLKAASK